MVGRSAAVTTGRRSSAARRAARASPRTGRTAAPCASRSPVGPARAPARQARDRVDEQLRSSSSSPDTTETFGCRSISSIRRGGQLQETHPPLGHLDVLDVPVVVVVVAGRRRAGRGTGPPPSAPPAVSEPTRSCTDLGSSMSSSAASSRLRVAWIISRAAAWRCSMPCVDLVVGVLSHPPRSPRTSPSVCPASGWRRRPAGCRSESGQGDGPPVRPDPDEQLVAAAAQLEVVAIGERAARGRASCARLAG